MENFPSYSEDFGKTSQVDDCLMRSTGKSESEVLDPSKSPTVSFHSVYQPNSLNQVSRHPGVHPQSSSVKYSDKYFGSSSNLFRVAGLDMTNKTTPVNMVLNRQSNCSDLKTKTYNISSPIIASSFSKNDESGDNSLHDHGISIMSPAQSSNQTSFGPQTLYAKDVHCEEKMNVDCIYKCGGCEESFYTICKLHAHIKTHNENGSYYFSESTKTAYPKFDTHCKETQTNHKCHTKYSKLTKNNFNKLNDDSEQDTDRPRVDKDKPETSVVSLAFASEPEIKIEDGDADNCLGASEVNNSGSDTDDYKADESMLLNQKKRKKNSKRNCEKLDKTSSKGSKKLKKLKMTIKLKQEGRKENRVSFIKKDRKAKTRRNTSTNVKRAKADESITCKLCGEEFTKRLFLRHHIKAKHSDIEYLCQLCGEQFSVDEELIEHRKTVHNRGCHRCELCDKVLSTKGMLEGHYLVHKGIKPFACDICVPKKEFTRKCQLKAHMDTHSTEKTLQCEFCGKPFNARYLMLSHVKHCGGIKPHKCEYCEMSFVSNHCLQRHRRTHTGEKPFVCEVCAFASSNASCLARHMRTHTGEKPFTCQFCQQTFAARGALKKHIRIHTQEKPYKCRFCTKAFTQNWNLKTHERQHTGETPYKCHVCGIGYKQNVLLKTHMRTHFGQTSERSESQSISVNQSASQSQAENHSSLNCQPNSSMQTTFKSEILKSEFLESQSVNSQSHLTELNSQPLVPNILLSSFLHSGYNLN